MVLSSYFSTLPDNPYFGAGFGLFGIAALTAVVRRGTRLAMIFVRRRCITSLEITSNDQCFSWLLQYIAHKCGTRATHFEVETVRSPQTSVRLVPSIGTHYFFYKNSWIRVDRNREKVVNLNTGTPFETAKLSTFGRNRELFLDFIEQAYQFGMEEHKTKTHIYTPYLNEWRLFGAPRRKRPLNSVILNKTISYRIVTDIENFLASSDWYAERGVPYRRGYLLYGPPGCGKSSFIFALAGHINHSICTMNLSEGTMTDDRLSTLMNIAPDNSVLVLEDIDAAVLGRTYDDERYRGMGPLTLSGLLNSLDGVASAEGRIVFMTTNYIERLDAALIRPGRVDVKEYIGYASGAQLKELLLKFYPNVTEEEERSFIEKITQLKTEVSPAQIQGLFMFYKNSISDLLSNMDNFFKRL